MRLLTQEVIEKGNKLRAGDHDEQPLRFWRGEKRCGKRCGKVC
jgi:hypothetical protein